MKLNKCKFCNEHISQRLPRYENILKQLSSANVTKRRNIIMRADCCLIKILCECALNVLKGNVFLNNDHIRKLSPHVKTLMKLSKTKNHPSNLHRRKQLLLKKRWISVPHFTCFDINFKWNCRKHN